MLATLGSIQQQGCVGVSHHLLGSHRSLGAKNHVSRYNHVLECGSWLMPLVLMPPSLAKELPTSQWHPTLSLLE